MSFSKTMHIQSGHEVLVESISQADLPELPDMELYTKFYVVKNWDAQGVVFFWIGRGHPSAPKQVVVWYHSSHKMWSSYGLTIKAAIEGAQKDGWLYA